MYCPGASCLISEIPLTAHLPRGGEEEAPTDLCIVRAPLVNQRNSR